MRVLFVCSGNRSENSPFVHEQANSIRDKNIQVDLFYIKGHGYKGYLKNIVPLREKVRAYNYDLIHAHYGLAGMVASLAASAPVVVTYHGDDINIPKNRMLSFVASRLARSNIYVSERLLQKAIAPKNGHVIPCGVDLKTFYPIDKLEARERVNFVAGEFYVLFSGAFAEPVKNVSLARDVLSRCPEKVHLIELKGYSRSEVNLLMNACDALLMTSFSEGSPQVIKEAMACNCPIVATDVGDVRELIAGTRGCYVTDYDPQEIATKLRAAMRFGKTDGRERIEDLDVARVADKVVAIYKTATE